MSKNDKFIKGYVKIITVLPGFPVKIKNTRIPGKNENPYPK